MILGVSVVLAVFSYFAYRHLSYYVNAASAAAPETGSPPSGGPALFVWPFVSALLRQHSPDASSLTRRRSADGIRPVPDRTPLTISASLEQLPSSSSLSDNDTESPNTTPKATPRRPSDAIPEISLNLHMDDEDDNLPPPTFPAPDSAQRASSVMSSLAIPAPQRPPQSTGTMAPPPIPFPSRYPRQRQPHAATARQLTPPSAAARSRLAVVGAGAAGVAAGTGLTLPGRKSNSRSRKVVLEPGHSPLDWARLQKSGVDLRGLCHSQPLIKVTPSMLAEHKKGDIWMALSGMVYNVTAYIPFHPGGEKELLRGAGTDGTKLFNATHPWVNIGGMLGECLIGILVSEEEASISRKGESSLEMVD